MLGLVGDRRPDETALSRRIALVRRGLEIGALRGAISKLPIELRLVLRMLNQFCEAPLGKFPRSFANTITWSRIHGHSVYSSRAFC